MPHGRRGVRLPDKGAGSRYGTLPSVPFRRAALAAGYSRDAHLCGYGRGQGNLGTTRVRLQRRPQFIATGFATLHSLPQGRALSSMESLQLKQMRRASGESRKMGFPNCGISLACNLGGALMRLLPLGITLIMKRTRSGWKVTLRVHF